jgi:hypothetical protein
VHFRDKVQIDADTGFLGMTKIHANTVMPRKRSKKKPLTEEDKAFKRKVPSERVTNEHVTGFIKRFKIVADRYRNPKKRFRLRFNLIAGICNFDSSI